MNTTTFSTTSAPRGHAQPAATTAIDASGRPVYGPLARALHWLMALSFVALFVSGAIMTRFGKDDSLRAAFYNFHKSVGVTILVLLALRLAVRLWRGTPADSPRLPAWERHAAHAAHWTLYVLMAITPIAGWAISDLYGYGVAWFGWPLPKVFPTEQSLGPLSSSVHIWLAYSFLGLIAVHLLAVAKHRYVDRDCVMHRMA